MLKRSAALLFILVIAGQVYAGVCGCLDNGGMTAHSCCRSKKISGDAMRPSTCCDTDCIEKSSRSIPQERTEPAAKVKFKPVIQQAQKVTSIRPVAVESRVPVSMYTDHRLKYSRPPELYLRHHAFLI